MPDTDRSDPGLSLSCCLTNVIHSDTDIHIIHYTPLICCCSGTVFPSRLVLNVADSLFQLEEAEWALEPFFGVMGVDCDLPSSYVSSQVIN